MLLTLDLLLHMEQPRQIDRHYLGDFHSISKSKSRQGSKKKKHIDSLAENKKANDHRNRIFLYGSQAKLLLA